MPIKRTDKSTAHSLFSGLHQSSENELATKLSSAAGITMENPYSRMLGKRNLRREYMQQGSIYVWVKADTFKPFII